jgi:biuret amidohydrolase
MTVDMYKDTDAPSLPPTDVEISIADTALVVTDPQIDFLDPKGVTWGVVGESVTEHKTVENIGRLFTAAKSRGMTVAVSPHYYYPTDHDWQFEGPLEKLMHDIGMFDRKSSLDLSGFKGSGADFMPQYKDQILDGETIVCSPHKIYGPQQNDLVLQLRKRRISKVILAGMSANLCTQAHLYELLEQGFEVAVVRDATAAAKIPEGDGYLAAIINFRFVANALWWTDEAVARIEAAG